MSCMQNLQMVGLIDKSGSRSCDTKAFFANWITIDETAFAFSTLCLKTPLVFGVG